MINSGFIYLHSKYKILEIKTEKYELYLLGNPFMISTTNGRGNWINDFIKEIDTSNLSPEMLLTQKLKSTSGLFFIILLTENRTILASDIIRSYPLFYGVHNNKFFVTNDLCQFQKENGRLEINNKKLKEFFATGIVYGNGTLYKEIYGLQAAEIVSINGDGINSERYFKYQPAENPDIYENLAEFARAYDNLFLFVFSRMVEQYRDVRNWIVPLSGGHDSRLIVNYIYRLGIKNVKCFSYGILGNEQAQISKQVAEALGYEWHFVEYTDKKWLALHESGIFDDYINFAFNGVSTPHLQDFLAVYELKLNGLIGEGDIFLPGHSIVGTTFNENTLKLKTAEEALQYVYSKVISMTEVSNQKTPTQIALQEMFNISEISPDNFYAYCDWQERQTKYITNSIKVYEFFGFESLQPMWDKEFVDFWLRIPVKGRKAGREPLFEMEKQGALVEQLIKIPFAHDHQKSLRQIFTGNMKKVVPAGLIVNLLHITRRRTKLNEGLNQIYALKANSVKDLLAPVDDFPHTTLSYFKLLLERAPYQMNPVVMTTLFTARKLLDRAKV